MKPPRPNLAAAFLRNAFLAILILSIAAPVTIGAVSVLSASEAQLSAKADTAVDCFRFSQSVNTRAPGA